MCDFLLRHASDRRRLEHDPVLQAAAQRWIEVLGEASSHVSDDVKRAHPEVDWRKIVGMRVVLAHGYFSIDQAVIANAIEHHVPLVRAQLVEILDTLPADPD